MDQVRTYPEGVTSWIDVEHRDIEKAKEFYGGLFGWTFADATPPGASPRYVIAQLDGRDVAGLGEARVVGGEGTAGGGEPAWNTYVAVEDSEGALDRIRSAGGRVLSGPEAAGEGGWSTVCADPAGVVFRLWQARRRPGAQAVNVPGAWNFSDLHAADPAAAREFYGRVFGWQFDDLGFGSMIRVPGYGDHLQSTSDPEIHERQSGIAAPPGFADAIGWLSEVQHGEAPHWHVAFTVADRDATAADAERLGGTVLDRTDTDWTRDAVIRDPWGADFTASQFTPPTG
ncbi:VOC family protein [Arthrobacter sp. CAU 1506]|uniref:VOC family protein n=1 Tax=Arthrobacter sp. CAU 1506 TaxID=2560052 RepID=UPI0010AD3828|nr:VOC family protein [Arthrobacter sp. CAU 1506]TJY70866.1 VOC family protein [Arthrobacter sp. CAU 1506]